MHIRPANDQDVAVIQQLYDEAYPEPIPKAHQIIKNQHVRVIETEDGSVVGFRAISPPRNSVWVAVLPEYRQRGFGSLLMKDALEQAAELGLPELTSRVIDSNSAGNAFCERFKFKPYIHWVSLMLDLTQWDESVLTPALAKAQAEGIEFKTFADLGDNAANQHKLYTLNKTLAATIPRDEPQAFVGFETYVEGRLSAKIMPHDGIFLAVADGEWIGMTQMSLEEDYSFNQMTGVLPAYRGRGIAQALKSLGIRFVAQNHYTRIWTFNDVSNHPMIAVNENAGFRQVQRFSLVRRKPILEAQ